jgi:hypothetical protein
MKINTKQRRRHKLISRLESAGYTRRPHNMSDLETNQKAGGSQNPRTANDNYALYEADRVAKREAQTAAKPAHALVTCHPTWGNDGHDEARGRAFAEGLKYGEAQRDELLAALKLVLPFIPGNGTYADIARAAIAKVEAGQ